MMAVFSSKGSTVAAFLFRHFPDTRTGMFTLRPFVRASLLTGLTASLATAGGLQPDDLVAICGDSITEQNATPTSEGGLR